MPGGGDWRYWEAERTKQVEQKLLQAEQARVDALEAEKAQDDGRFRLNTDVTDKEAEEMGARVTREQFERYMNEFVPAEQALIGSLGANNAQQAAANSTADAMRARASLDRMRERYGTSLNVGQRGAESRQFTNQTRLSQLSATNSARQLDEDRDFNLRGTMLNIGNNLSSSAMSGLSESAMNASARNNAHQAALADHKAAKSQQTAQTISSIAAIGAIAL